MLQKLISAIIISLLLLACGENKNPSVFDGDQLTSLEKSLVESDNKFTLKLFKEVVQAEADTNIFISPLSVSMALGMTLNGAANETQEAMETTLEFGSMTTDEINRAYRNLIEFLTQLDPKVVFTIANSIWYRQEMAFEQAFLDAGTNYFDALVKPADFSQNVAVAEMINNWVKDNTNNKIEKILNPGDITDASVMFLLNAIYFLGTWTYEFDKAMTNDTQFILPGGATYPCKMMMQKNEFSYFENDNFQAIDLPYGDGAFMMTIFLPKWDNDLDSFINSIDNDHWNTWTQSFERDSVLFEMPKFKLEYDVKLNDMLIAMGMGVAFSTSADFTRMYTPGGLFISYVKHKTFVRVDEEGTEAAAVTIVAVELTSVGSGNKIKYMRVDRPFVFAIRENLSGAILFMGKVVNPRWED